MKKSLPLLLLLLIAAASFSQTKIQIAVLDSVTKAPLPFATIYAKSVGVGTTTNLEGEAYLFIKNTQLKLDTLVCSYVGYEKKIIPIKYGENSSLKLELSPSSTTLNEIEIISKKPLSIKKILKTVIKNTNKNYSNSAVNLDGFYREIIQENGKYISLNEAIVDIHYTSYPQNSIDLKSYKKWQYDDSYAFEYKTTWFDGFPMQFNTRDDKLKLIVARSSEKSSTSNFDFPINGGPLSLTAKDYVKYRYDFLNPKTFDNYRYQKQESETINGRNCYVLHFYPKESDKKVIFNHIRKNQNSIYVGNIYVDKESFAVVKIEYQLIQNFDYGFYQSRIPLDYKVTVHYKNSNSKWYLHKITLQQIRSIYTRKSKQSKLFNAIQELYITNIDTIAVHEIDPDDEWKHTKLTQLRTYEMFYDEDVWKDFEKTQYPALPIGVKLDLEVNKSLNEQFKNRFKQKENLPKPTVSKEKYIFNYPFETLEDDYQWFSNANRSEDFYQYIKHENEYAENYLLPYRTYQRTYFDALNNFYIEDTTETKYNHKKGGYAWDTDSLENIALYEYLDSTNKKTIFQYSKFKKNRANCYVTSRPKITKTNLGLTYTSNGGLNNQLIIFKKGSLTVLDSISDIYTFEWFNDSLLLYTKENEVKRSDKLFCRNINTNSDSLLLFEKDLTFDIEVSKTKSYLVCTIQSNNESEIYLTTNDANYPNFKPIIKRQKDVYATIKEFNELIYVLTNDKALNNKICLLDDNQLKDIVPHEIKTYIQDYIITENYIVLKTYKKSLIQLTYKRKEAKKWKKITFNKEIFEADVSQLKDDKLGVNFSTPNTPSISYSFDLITEILTKEKTQKIKRQYEYDLRYIQTKRLWAKSKDGVKIPMTIIKSSYPKRKHKGLILKAYGMYGSFYGGYGFDSEDFTLLKEGYTIVYAHVRGGGEMGKQWYIDGKLLNKENTFNDYITCAEYLIDKKYTDTEHLIGYGNSAGGLLMGVVINKRPELFNTVILDHPYLDALTTMMMDTLPLTTDHYKEVGNPNEKEYYDYMKGYSPYHNIKKQAYPNLLFIASSNDFQTPTWQIAKYVAKLREYNTGSNEIIFKTDIGSGHIGNTNGNQWMKDLSYKNTFIYINLFK